MTVFVLEGDFRFAAARRRSRSSPAARSASLLAGLGFALRPLAARPARVLRARE